MSTTELLKHIELLIRAKYSILYLVSWEESRVIQCLDDIAKKNFTPAKEVFTWSCTEGMKKGVEVDIWVSKRYF